MNETTGTRERRLLACALLAGRVEGDRLLLDDATLRGALDGSRPLADAEKNALRASPLTLRRFRALADARRAADSESRTAWQRSTGLLRAAADSTALAALATDDGHWALHFLREDDHWQVVLKLDAGAPFAARLLGEGAVLAVRDGAGGVVLQGSLDGDGECEQAWPFGDAPGEHFQRRGAAFSVARLAAAAASPVGRA